MNIKDAYNCYLEQHKLKDIEILSLEGRETLKKSEIYKIVACLMDEISNINEIDDLVGRKIGTWRKYIDYFPKVFNVNLYAESSQEIPLIKALLCIGFILIFEDQVYFSTKMKKQQRNPEYITRIKRTINKENKKESEIGKFEELLSYDEKNEFITNLGEIFSIYNYDEFGIKEDIRIYDEKNELIEWKDYILDCNREESELKEDGRKIGKVVREFYINDLEQFKKNQIKFKMLAEIQPYENEIYLFASRLRMETALEELRNRFIYDTRENFKKSGEAFLKGLEDNIAKKSSQLFDMNNESGYSSDDLSDELINIFNEYVEKEFDAFKQNWICKSKDFDFDPYRLI